MKQKSNYSLRYQMDQSTRDLKIEVGEFDTKKVLHEGYGGCDELGIISVIGKVLGGTNLSIMVGSVTHDGRNWDTNQWFEIWVALNKLILDNGELDPLRTQLLEDTFAMARDIKLSQINNK